MQGFLVITNVFMTFLKTLSYRIVLKSYLLKNLSFLELFLFNDIYSIIFFSLFRAKHKKSDIFKKIIVFYKIYKDFVTEIKKFILGNFLKIYWKVLYFNFLFLDYRKLFIKKKQNIKFLNFLKTDYIFIKFSFLNFFISIDLINFFFITVNNFFLFYIFQAFIKTYINHKNTYLFFRNIWFLTNMYMFFLENFTYKTIGSFILKNYSNWNLIYTCSLNSCLYSFYQYNNYKIYYIRISNLLYIYFFCKIKYVLSVYNNIKLFLKFFLKANLFYENLFNFILISKTKSLKVKKNIFKFSISRYKLRLYFLLFFITFKNNKKYNFYIKKLTIIIMLQTFLEYFKFTYNKKYLLTQMTFIAKKYLLV